MFHGHWHHIQDTELAWIDRTTTEQSGELAWRSARVIGLGCDGDVSAGWVVLNLGTLDISWPTRGAASRPTSAG